MTARRGPAALRLALARLRRLAVGSRATGSRAIGLLALASALGSALAMSGPAGAATPALVVDVETGRVLYAERATDPWYPASITKLMTTYVALDQVRQGKASLDQLITISALAAAEPPSKMGFKPGTQLTLDNALKIIMVKSANDIAWAIGENLGGSVEGFAQMMNEAAARIGMRESRWFNPNGLPDERQWTSARDMATLGRALLRDFPDNRDLFSISAIQFGRRVMANHNGLLGRYPGVDGMKTGFICSGGFNVVASATRGGRRIITVVMGSPNARERTVKAADLFDFGFAQSGGAQKLEDLPASARATPPDLRPVICDRRKPMPEEDSEPAITAGGAGIPGGAAGNADNASAQLMAAAAPPSAALAFVAMNSASWKTRALPPRAPLQPVLVWIGRDPAEGALAAAAAEGADGAEAPKGRGRRKLVARAARLKPLPSVRTTPVIAEAEKPASPRPGSSAKASGTVTGKVAGKASGKASGKDAAKDAAKGAQRTAKALAKPVRRGAKASDDE